MASWCLALSLLVLLQAKPAAAPVPETAADVVTLRDGTVVLGQVAETAMRRGGSGASRAAKRMTPAGHRGAGGGRGLAAAGSGDPVAIARLLRILPESAKQGLPRRAATEATHDAGVRFIQVQNLLLPEPVP